ncbi:IS66 family transposase, partial [Mesorhizobium sp. M0012]
QADAFGGYGDLYATGRQPAPVLEASCWAHSRRKVFELADVEAAARKKAHGEKPNLVYPLAVEAVKRIDALFDIERAINGLSPAQRHAVRQERSAPLVTELERWMIKTRDKLSRGHDLTKAFNYMLRRWSSFARFLDDGRICLSNNAAERALRGIALGRKSWLFCGSDRGGQRAAVLYSLIVSAKMNDVDPQAWLADVLARLPAYPAHRIDDLLPWNWRSAKLRTQPAAA